jgi:predicted molibdopterin-dependent oxidoreductase YjgC
MGMGDHAGQFVRAVSRQGPRITLHFDGEALEACEGDSLLAALLTQRPFLRRTEFGSEPRAGFCMMGACQDCWVWSETGGRLRACTTNATAGMVLRSQPPGLDALRG